MKKIILIIFLLTPLIMGGASCRTKERGIFGSTDGGETWERKTESYSILNVADVTEVAIDPKDDTIIYAVAGSSLFRSSDRGKNWTQAQVFASPISLFKIHPLNQDILYVASGKALARSADRGNSFKEVFYEQKVLGMAFHRERPETIYITTDRGSILKSDNNGGTWQNLYWDGQGKDISLIEIIPGNPNLIFAVVSGDKIIKSVDGGIKFDELDKRTEGRINDIEVQNENTLYLATTAGLLKTTDSGKTFYEFKTLIPPKEVGVKVIQASNNNIFYYATEKAIYKTMDAGRTWKVFRITNNVFYTSLAVSFQDPNIIFVGSAAPAFSFSQREND